MSGTGSYNAVTWLLDRNLDEGRGDKLAFTDTVSELTYVALQTQSRRLANLLRRLGVHSEQRVAMIMLDTTDFPVVFLGAMRAGAQAFVVERHFQGADHPVSAAFGEGLYLKALVARVESR